MILRLFKTILDQINDINHPVISLLNEPIQPLELDSFLTEFPIYYKLKKDLFRIYQISNGTNTSENRNLEELYLLSNFYFMSISEVKTVLKSNAYSFLDLGLFPFFSSGNGEYLTIKVTENERLEFLKIYIAQNYDATLESIISIYDNVYKFFETGIKCYQDKIFYIENNNLFINIEEEYDISRKLNPNSDFWNY